MNIALGGFALQQNVPNPFDQTTTINAAVPESIQHAKIIIYNLQGLELESYLLTGRGNTSVIKLLEVFLLCLIYLFRNFLQKTHFVESLLSLLL